MPVSLICPTCGRSFTRKPSAAAKVKVNYCSRACRQYEGRPKAGATKACQRCGAPFYVPQARIDAKFCSQTCAWASYHKPSNAITLDCAGCGEPFSVDPGRAAKARYCSRACRSTGENRACERCGKPFYVTASRVARGEGRFCSLVCHNLNQDTKVEFVCRTCGDTFRRSPSWTTQKAGLYCSLACRTADPEWLANSVIASNRASSLAHPTSLEAAGFALLDTLGEQYERFYTIGGKFTVDAAYPDLRIVVQFDGDYWHDRAGTSVEPRIRRRVGLDDSQDAYLAAARWRVLRYWESTVHDTPSVVAESVSGHLRLPLAAVREHGRVVRL